ncbi:MAG TPA: hypothetical protein PLV68_06395, partial [Ilumatobacteraceae bacterium]|nr:hypothetical protein [Ilumatobacteraceae bacterium]
MSAYEAGAAGAAGATQDSTTAGDGVGTSPDVDPDTEMAKTTAGQQVVDQQRWDGAPVLTDIAAVRALVGSEQFAGWPGSPPQASTAPTTAAPATTVDQQNTGDAPSTSAASTT